MLGSASTAGAGFTIINTPILPISGYPNSGLMQVDSRNDRLYFALNNKAFLLNNASKIGQSGRIGIQRCDEFQRHRVFIPLGRFTACRQAGNRPNASAARSDAARCRVTQNIKTVTS